MHPSPFPHARRGFTLTELLVVIGIIVLLIAIGLPMVLRAYKQGNKMRTQADLNSISVALNAYKQDFGDYPRIIDGTVPSINTGAAVLGRALIGPYGDGVNLNPPGAPTQDTSDPPTYSSLSDVKSGQCVRDGGGFVALVDDPGAPAAGDNWARFDARDGADGPGFRTRVAPDGTPQGRVWGPYLQAEKFNLNGVMLHDREGNPILYFPAAPGRPNIRSMLTTASGNVRGFVDFSRHSRYNANDNIVFFKRPVEGNTNNALRAIRAMLGDMDDDGIIDPGETPATEADFILWTAGPDGQYGPIRPAGGAWTPTRRDIERCDDVTNFTP